MIKFFREGEWHINSKRLYNVLCWYDDNACEVFQIVAYSKDDAIVRAKNLAWLKGYRNVQNDCTFTI